MDRILNEARELGIYGIVLSGGEPFVYPYLLDMAQKHNDMAFMVYTNGTKIDENVADRLQELGYTRYGSDEGKRYYLWSIIYHHQK